MKKSNITKVKAILLLFMVILLHSCKKAEWYNVKSSSLTVVPTSLADMQSIMNSTGVLNAGDPALGEAGSDGHYLTSVGISLLSSNLNDRNAYTWSMLLPYLNVADWNAGTSGGAYSKIFYSNLVLEELMKISPKNSTQEDEWSYIKGQALFFRAKSFFEIAQIYAPPYDSNMASSELGIPLRFDPDPAVIVKKRSSLKQTYEQIISDLSLAKDLLSKNISPSGGALQKTRPSQVAAYAMLARVYLSIEDYDNALANVNLSLQAYSTLLDYNNIADYKPTATRPIASFNTEVIFHSTMLNTVSSGLANLLIDPTLYSLFETEDWRRTGNFNVNTTTGNIVFKATYSGSTALFTGLTTGELYLIRAECYARKNNVAEAMKDLNTLLAKRYKNPFIPKTAIDANDALSKIIDERKKELMLRGLRWSDLRRLNRDDRFKTTIKRTVEGKDYVLEPGSFRYTLPFPDDLIQMTGMEQNKGW